MKKVTATIITENGEVKTVSVKLDDKTATLLEQSGNLALIEAYVAAEHEANNLERRESRRHLSLNRLIDNGFDMADEKQNPLENMILAEKKAAVKAALQTLTERQMIIVSRYVFERQSFREIGDFLGINKESVRIEYKKSIKKLQKFFNFGLSKRESRGL